MAFSFTVFLFASPVCDLLLIVVHLNMEWDLQVRLQCHEGAVVSCQFFRTQPLMLTSGTDNALKLWIFDQVDGRPRLLRSRCGHTAPPTRIRYYGTDSRAILSAAQDRSLRYFSTFRDEQSEELSQGSLAKKARVAGLASEQLKQAQITDFAAG